jgi:vancomycin resistance protein YoaR
MENSVAEKPAKNKKKTLTIVLLSLLAAVIVLGGVFLALKIKADKEEEERQSLLNSGVFYTGITVGGVDVSGMSLDQAKEALKEAEEKLTENVGFTVTDGEHTYTIDKSFFDISYNTEEKLAEAMAEGRDDSLTLEELKNGLSDIAANGRSFDIEYTIATPDFTEFAASIAAEINVAPVDATFSVKQLEMNEDTDALNAVNIGIADDDTVTDLRDLRFDFVEGVPGSGLNEQALIEELTSRTEARDFGTVEFTSETIEPQVTIATIKETLVLRSKAYTSYAKGHYGRAERVHNMTKACGLMYGTVLQPGEVFSCNTLLGDRYEKYGWQLAPAVIEGGASTEDQPGGGVCQVSTTVYNAVLMGDYEVVYRQAHSSRLSYVPGGLDATINTGTIDFKWSNNTSSPIYVFTWIDTEQKRVWCEIYGEPFGEDAGFDEIELISERLPDIEPTADEYITYSGLIEPYWMLKNEAKTGYVYDTYKSYKLNGVEVKREKIANTIYRMHPRRYYVWPGYVAGTVLQAEYQLPLPEKTN